MNLEGKMLGNRYEIIEKIGNGGMAIVYKAKCHVLNRFVAVKILKDEFTTDEEFIKRFAAEGQSAASLTHPNIVSIYDVGNEESLYYIVMELVKGKTLKEIIEEDGKLPWKWSVNIAIQIASALEAAHKNNIVHRDIKPHNIIITEEGIAKVTDFGIAKAVSNSTITAFGTTIGSVHYFSPEHARGGHTDPKSDLYSLGVVMYEMLTGKVPFDADTPVSIALKHMQEDPNEPMELNDQIPISVNKIILKSMQKDPNCRYGSATEILRDLNMALKTPDADFVFIRNSDEDFLTQKIPIYNNVLTEDKKADNSENRGKNKSNKKQNKFIAFIKRHKKLSMFIGAILLFFLAFGGTALFFNLTAVKDVQIPELVGLSREEAEAKLKELKFKFEIESEEFSDEVEENHVISQDPEYRENFKIKEKSTIKVVISKGSEIVKVPKLSGLTQEEAVSMLEDLNLEVEIIEETSKKIEEGIVISQNPAANTEVNSGSTVKLTVSKGTGIVQVAVPGVVGKSEQDAKNSLTALGLKVSVANEEDRSKDNGVVLKQSITAGTNVDEGSTVTITVNKVSESKNATINVNIKNITGGYDTSDTTITDNKKKVKVEVSVVSGEGSGFTKSDIDKNGQTSGTVTGKGQVTIQLKITDNSGGTWSQSHTMNLNNDSAYTFN